MPVGENHLLRFGPYQLDKQCGQLRKNGFGLKLQGQPVQILEILLEKPGELVTREELRHRLWSSDTFVDFDHSLNTAIKRLRQALGDEAETPHYIETLPKRGYRFIGEVCDEGKEHKPRPVAVFDETVEKIAATLAEAATSASKESRSLRKWRVAALSVVGLVAVGVTVFWVIQPPPMPQVVRSYPLTKTGFKKSHVLTDGIAIYFTEARPSHAATMRMPAAGGESVETATRPGLYELWRANADGTGARRLAELPDINVYNSFPMLVCPIQTSARNLRSP